MMVFHCRISGDSLELIPVKENVYTGNVNTYSCLCEFDGAWGGLEKFAVFSDGENCVTDLVPEDGRVIIPAEILSAGKKLLVGFFADSPEADSFKRISTGFAEIAVQRGAYQEDMTAPEIPAPDLWEKLVNRNIPQIGENGNWQLYDINEGGYRDSGVAANPGMTEIKQITANAMPKKVTVNAQSIEAGDVSPLEHKVRVKTANKNIINTKLFACGNFTVSDDQSTIKADTSTGWYSEKIHSDEPIIKKGSVITISVGEYTCDTNAALQVHLQDTEKNISSSGAIFKRGTENGKVTVTVNIDVKDIFISVNNYNSTAVIKNLQIEYGDEASEYDGYREDLSGIEICEEFSGETATTDADGFAEIKSSSPQMKITSDGGMIEYIEYNRDTNSVLEMVEQAIAANADTIDALREALPETGRIYHDWFYPSGGAGASGTTIASGDYGIFIVTSSGSVAKYTCNESGDISKSSKLHIFIKSLNSNGTLNTMWHLYGSSALSTGQQQSYPISNITITNSSTTSGMNVIRIPMRSPK